MIGVGSVSGTGDSVEAGRVVTVDIGIVVAVGKGVTEGVGVSGAEVADDAATVWAGRGAVGVVRFNNAA